MVNTRAARVDDLVYRTRGREWDYAFLLQPPPLLAEGWYGVHRRVFADFEPNAEPRLLGGAFGKSGATPFVATAFTDAERRDAQGRAIVHYVLWLGQPAESPLVHFGPGLLRAFGPALDQVFGLEPARFGSAEAAFDAQLARRFRAALGRADVMLPLAPTSNAPVRDLGRLI